MAHELQSISAVCRCGETTIELTGEPIQSVTCYCESCRTAARGFERDLGAPQTVTAEGGVDYCLYRKDRVKIAHGAHHLREYRLKPNSPTRRVVVSCCGSPMFLDFTSGHWLTVFRDRLPGQAPEPQMRIMTQGQTQRLGAVERDPGLRYAAGSSHDQAARRLGGDGIPPSKGRLVMVPKTTAAPHAGGIFSNFGRAGSTWSQAWPRTP